MSRPITFTPSERGTATAPEESAALAALAARGMQVQCTVQEGEAWLNIGGAELRVVPQALLSTTN